MVAAGTPVQKIFLPSTRQPPSTEVATVAGRSVVMARHDCFTDSAPLMLGPLGRFHALVTGERPPSRMERVLRGAGVDLLLVGENGPEAPGGEPAGRMAPVSPADLPSRVAGVRSSPVSMIGRPA